MSKRTADRRCWVWLVTKNDSLASLARLEKPCSVTDDGSMPLLFAMLLAVSGSRRSTGTRVVRIEVWVVRVRAVATEIVAMAMAAAITTCGFIGNGLCGKDCRCRRLDKSWRTLWVACPREFRGKWICL